MGGGEGGGDVASSSDPRGTTQGSLIQPVPVPNSLYGLCGRAAKQH